MKNAIMMMLMVLCCTMGSMAQSAADKILGTYKAVQE